MKRQGNIYFVKISSDMVNTDGLGYYLKTVDNSTPPNIIYYGFDVCGTFNVVFQTVAIPDSILR